MQQQDFYSGQVVNQSSEQEATNMASFGKYDFEPGARAMNFRNNQMMNQQVINPGGFGYNTMNQPIIGIGSPYRFSATGNVMPTYQNYYPGGNPVFQQNQFYNPSFQQQPVQQQATYQINGVGQGGEYLAPFNIEEKIDELQHKYWNKYIEQQAKTEVDRRAAGYSGMHGTNYYGVPYYNPYQYNSLNQEIAKEVDEIKSKAKQNRLDFEIGLSKLAHKFAGHEIKDEELLRERYEGKVLEVPKAIVDTTNLVDLQQQMRLENLVPFDNSQYYRDQYAQVSEKFNSVISKDADMDECFSKMGIIYSDWEMEDELHRRRNVSTMYNSEDNTYKNYVRRMAEERYAAERGLTLPPNGSVVQNPLSQQQQLINQFPTLANSVQLGSDGTLNVTCNVGSHAGQKYSVNDNEAKYQERKERFDRFLSSVTGSIYKNYSNG